jgi:putative ABC transport system permease protein
MPRGKYKRNLKKRVYLLPRLPSLKYLIFRCYRAMLTALKDPNSVLLSKETAEKYFGDWKTAMGKTIKWDNKDVLKVTGILAPIPKTPIFSLKVVLSLGTGITADMLKSKDWDSTGSNFGCYVLLAPNVTEAHLTGRLRALNEKIPHAR